MDPVQEAFLSKKFMGMSMFSCDFIGKAAVHMENSTETSIVATVYDADGFMEKTLTQYQGLVKFVLCGSEEEVKQMVLRDKAECGYILPAQILEQMAQPESGRLYYCI